MTEPTDPPPPPARPLNLWQQFRALHTGIQVAIWIGAGIAVLVVIGLIGNLGQCGSVSCEDEVAASDATEAPKDTATPKPEKATNTPKPVDTPKPTNTTEATKAAVASRCEVPGRQLVDLLSGALTVKGGGSLRFAAAVRSRDYESVYFVAADVQGPGIDGPNDVAVWATTRLDGSGTFLSVDAVAKGFSSLPDASKTDAHLSLSDDGVDEARKCSKALSQ